MSERLIDILLRLAPRERALLALLCCFVLPLALCFGVLLPLAEARNNAQAELDEARALTLWVQERAADQTLLLRTDNGGPRDKIGLSGVEQSLISAGLRDQLSEVSNRAGDAIELRFDAVAFEDLAGWLLASDPVWGYDIVGLQLERSETPGIVFSSLTLVPQGSD